MSNRGCRSDCKGQTSLVFTSEAVDVVCYGATNKDIYPTISNPRCRGVGGGKAPFVFTSGYACFITPGVIHSATSEATEHVTRRSARAATAAEERMRQIGPYDNYHSTR
jgi:hypothetical protein